MILRPYSMDAHTRAQELASSVLSSSSPPAIASAISAVDSILADQPRAFFSIAFPAIICRLFGFDESPTNPTRSPSASTAWIDQAHNNPDLAARLFVLLSPEGPLFSAISSADRHGLVKYVFPAERLPEWMRYMLQSERHSSILSDLCPLFRGRVKEDIIQGFQLQLNAFEYYMFWFAYYPVCRRNINSSDDSLAPKSRRKSRLESWTSSLPVLVNPSRRSDQNTEVCLYLRLLYSYLCTFVPKCGFGSQQPYRSSLLHYSSSCDISVFEQAEFLVNTLIHFWLVDNDFSPLPLNVCRSFGISFQHRAFIVETPPTAGLGNMVKLFVKYLGFCLVLRADGSNKKVLGSVGTSSMRSTPSLESTACSWNSVVQRPLYRFLLRTFLFCPIGASMKNVAQVLSVWVTYMVPWRIHPEDFDEYEPPTVHKLESSKKELVQGKFIGENERCNALAVYTPLWEGYVASNYLFYSSLVVHFLGFAHKFLHANVEAVVDMVLKVLSVLTSSKELIDLLRKVDTAYHSKQSGLYSHTNVYKYVPSIRQHLKDWEEGLCESDTDGSFLHENWNQDLKLFNDGEDGALKLLQLFVLRAEHEIHMMSSDNMRSLQSLDSIKSQMNILFDGAIVSHPHLPNTLEEPPAPAPAPALRHFREDVFAPKHPGFGTGKWAEYKGDLMLRPISDTEVAWLARLLIRFSNWLNESLGFDCVASSSSGPCQPSYVELASCDLSFEGGPKEVAVMLLNLIACWLGLFGHSVVSFMRGHGMRINLRMLSSKKLLLYFLILYVIVFTLPKAFNKAAAWSLADEVELTRTHT